MKNSQRYIYDIGQGRLKDTKEVDEQTATDTELYNNLQNDPVRYVDVMTHKYDNNKKPKDYPRKIVVPTRKVTDQTPAKNKEISHGEPIDVQELSKDVDGVTLLGEQSVREGLDPSGWPIAHSREIVHVN